MKSLRLLKYLLIAVSVASVLLMSVMGEFQAVGIMLTWAYILFAAALLTAVVLSLVNIVRNPRKAWRSMVGLSAIAVLTAACYLFSSSEPVTNSAGGVFAKVVELKLTDTGLYLAYIALGATILVVIFTEIRRSIK